MVKRTTDAAGPCPPGIDDFILTALCRPPATLFRENCNSLLIRNLEQVTVFTEADDRQQEGFFMCGKEELVGRDSKVRYDAISRQADSSVSASAAAEGSCNGNGAQPRILPAGSSCTCCLSHAISTSNLALAGKHYMAQRPLKDE